MSSQKYRQPAQSYFYRVFFGRTGNGGRSPYCGYVQCCRLCRRLGTLSRAHREAHEEDRGPTDPTAGGRGPTRAGERLSLPRTHQVYASRAAHRRCLVSVTARKCLRNEMSCWGLWFYFAVISLPKCVRST